MEDVLDQDEIEDVTNEGEGAPDVFPIGGEKAEEMGAKIRKRAFDFMEKTKGFPELIKDQSDIARTQAETEKRKVKVMEEFLYVVKEEGGIPIKIKNDESEGMEEEVVVVEEIPKEEAKDDIVQYFKNHPGEDITPTDLNLELEIPYETVVEVIKELKEEGNIEES